jgi:hypothetical protein
MIDVVIVSNASTARLKEITQTAITTARTDGNVMVYVMEQQPKVQYEGAKTTNYTYPYNYNKCLNDGARQGTSPYIAFCNNDLVFTPGWTKITTTMQKQHIASASPICPKTAAEYGLKPNTGTWRGHDVRKLFCGWCFVWERKLWERYNHDEDFGFWTADNASARTIKRKGIKHHLDTNVTVHHIQSATLLTLDKETQQELTFGQIKKYNRKYRENLFNMGR